MGIKLIKNNPIPISYGTTILNMPLTENSVQTGIELIENGNFSSWSGAANPNNTPTGWTRDTSAAGYYIADATSAAQLISDGTAFGIWQNKLTVGKAYQYAITINDVTSGE
jgi:hypothetical protein